MQKDLGEQMRIWADIHDSADHRLGEGPIFAIRQAQVKRQLDGGGNLRATLIAADARAMALVQVGRIVKLWGEDHGGVRLLGEGIISTARVTDDPSGTALVIDGPDLLEELKRKNTLLGRVFNQATLGTVAADLIGLVPGWTVAVDSTISADLVDARFDGVNVLKAFTEIAKRYGIHIRMSDQYSRQLEVGSFGEDSGLRG